FVKVYGTLRPLDLDIRLRTAYQLSVGCGLQAVVAPLLTHQGEVLGSFGAYVVAVFPYVEHAVPLPSDCPDTIWGAVARMVAELHMTLRCPTLSPPPQENWTLAVSEWLHTVLTYVSDQPLPMTIPQAQAYASLASESADILATEKRVT